MMKPQKSLRLFMCCLCLSVGFVWACEPTTPPQTETTPESTQPSETAATEPSTGTSTDASPKDEALPEPTADTPPAALDLEMKAEDFGCLLKWEKVDKYRITNKLGKLDEALTVAKSKEGGVFPVGTIIQLVPQEAMVKRRKGWNPATNDWEFFFLDVSKEGTKIVTRGKEEVKNAFGGNCFSCHNKADAKWDLICGSDHGCDPIPLTPTLIENLQNSDPRCD